jgi:uncharacterized protein (DUF2141 family)
MTRRLIMALLLSGAGAMAIAAQQPGVRDRVGAPSPTGTGVIMGTIVSDDSSTRPVRRAAVTLAGSAFPAPHVAITDDDGRFTFDRLPSGSFTITADKPAYVRLYYGGKRPGRGPGVPIALADGQQVSLAMKMLHGAAITGTVLDASGRPAVEATIMVIARPAIAAARVMSPPPAGNATTDDRGVFRVFGLAPGDYLVFALPRRSGGDADIHAVTAEDVKWAQGRSTGALPATAPLPPSEPAVGFARVYFPGTTRISDAAAITLGPGEERTASFALQFVPTARIDGLVTDPTGAPARNAQVGLVPKFTGQAGDPRLDVFTLAATAGRVSVADGKFALLGVPPGSYTIVVRGGPAGEGGGGRGAPPFLGRGNAIGQSPWWGETDITVDGHDQSGVSIVMQPSLTVTGKLVFDGTTAPPIPVTRARVTLSSADPARPSAESVAAVNPDGSFVISNLAPGRYNLRAAITAGGTGWVLKAAMVNGHDVADVPLVVAASQDVTDAVVTFTDRPTDISGILSDAAGRGTPEFSIVVFSTDRAAWTDASRRIRATRPNSSGSFQISGLPPGEYFLAAVSDYDPQELYDPSFLEQLTAAPYKITLADGEHKKQDLRISGGR